MTERIYYNDPYARTFDARVVDVRNLNGRTAVTLDRTAFYPTSGGQPFDIGTLNNARVLEVLEDDDGEMLHVIEGTLSADEAVSGTIDWERRFDHMQQHTGQHVLSAAFDRLFKVRTESFHLGTESATIDLAREVNPVEIARAEKDANTVVWEDRPVAIRYADAVEAARLPLRKESAREGTLRLIDVEGYDISACGGTHVSRNWSHRRHRGRLLGEGPRRIPDRVRLRRPRAARVSHAPGRHCRERAAAVGAAVGDARGHRTASSRSEGREAADQGLSVTAGRSRGGGARCGRG